MDKYLCMCGIGFKNKKQADNHSKVYDDLEKDWRHIIVKRRWQARLFEWFLDLPGRRITRFIGVYLVYIVLVTHFKIEWSMLEATGIGLGLGLAID